MAVKMNTNPGFPLSFFDLFTHGLTNLSRHIYFSMGLALEIAEFNQEYEEFEFGVGIGHSDHEFLHEFARFLVAENIARLDYADYLIDWRERQLQPTFYAPLTRRGLQLVTRIHEAEKSVIGFDKNVPSIISERSFQTVQLPSDQLRNERIHKFQRLFVQ